MEAHNGSGVYESHVRYLLSGVPGPNAGPGADNTCGFSQINGQNDYSGYTYEYLMKIAQRTGWRYTFVPFAATSQGLQAALDQLQAGELDLMGAMNYHQSLEELYAYSTMPYGDSNFVLLADENNQGLSERTLWEYPFLTVACTKKAQIQNDLVAEFCAENGISMRLVYGETVGQCRQMVKDGVADVVVGKDVAENEGFRVVSAFSSEPFYFASTKGKEDLIQTLDQAIREIDAVNPEYRRALHKKYFGQSRGVNISLTAKEKEYLSDASPLRTVVLTGQHPISDYNQTSGAYTGFVVDIMESIARSSGITFSYIGVQTSAEAAELLLRGDADIIAGMPHDYASGDQAKVLITAPILSIPIMELYPIRGGGKKSPILVSNNIRIYDEQAGYRHMEDIEAIFMAIDQGKYQTAYVNGYVAQGILERNSYPNVAISIAPFINYELCIGVGRDMDLRVMSILEAAISNLSANEVQAFVYKNTTHARDISLSQVIRRNPIPFLVPVLGALAAIVFLLLLLVMRTKQRNTLISAERKRFEDIASLDQLTHTYNNQTFKSLAQEYLSQSAEPPFGALVVCDIDRFKSINDVYGHLMGDTVLEMLGAVLKAAFRENDLVGRLGGDEFVVLVKQVDDCDLVANRCTELLARCREISAQCEVTLSIGIAMFDGITEFDSVFALADQALYMAKDAGKNQFTFNSVHHVTDSHACVSE